MLDVETFIHERYPRFCAERPLLAKPVVSALRMLFHEKELQQFEHHYPHVKGFDFVEQVLDYFNFSYRLQDRESQRIPAQGKVVIIANHPIGSLDGLALLKMVREVRPDVKVVANDLLTAIKPLQTLLLPVDNMGGNTPRKNLQAIQTFLKNEGALIIFPAGEVSRLGARGVRDGKWNSGFLRIASAAKAPVLPVFVDGRNSTFFYALSFLARPLSTLWLVREMFKQAQRCVDVRIGEAISFSAYQKIDIPVKDKAQIFQRHLYRIGHNRPGVFTAEIAIARPENRHQLRHKIRHCQRLGETGDNKQIYLYQQEADCCIMREIGRLRELSFRAVDEGSGLRRDVDSFDRYYQHIILWDDDEREIAGAYRFCDANSEHPLYTQTLFNFNLGMNPYLSQGLELGRSFVQPKYQGKRSLDYLWYGIGAFLRANPQYRYLFGPVSLSNAYPTEALEMLVYFYQQHFPSLQAVASSINDFVIPETRRAELAERFPGHHYREEFIQLKSDLANMNLSVPTLYKQYTEMCDAGGVQFAGFNIDPTFSDCVDGLVIIDLARLKTRKRIRYITPDASPSPATPSKNSIRLCPDKPLHTHSIPAGPSQASIRAH